MPPAMYIRRATKIVATLGPVSSDLEVLTRMISTGVNVVRFNFSHGSAQDHLARAEVVREASRRAGREVAIMADLQGPKIRVGKFAQGKVRLQEGGQLCARCGPRTNWATEAAWAWITKSCRAMCSAGDVLLLNDGLIVLTRGAGAGRGGTHRQWWWAVSCPTTRASTSKAAA